MIKPEDSVKYVKGVTQNEVVQSFYQQTQFMPHACYFARYEVHIQLNFSGSALQGILLSVFKVVWDISILRHISD